MVYCDLKAKTENQAVYYVGTSTEDISGEVVFYKDLREPVILKLPGKSLLRMAHVAKIYRKYKDEFSQGIFKDKLSYEIG